MLVTARIMLKSSSVFCPKVEKSDGSHQPRPGAITVATMQKMAMTPNSALHRILVLAGCTRNLSGLCGGEFRLLRLLGHSELVDEVDDVPDLFRAQVSVLTRHGRSLDAGVDAPEEVDRPAAAPVDPV